MKESVAVKCEAHDRPSLNGLYFYDVICVNADVCVMINQMKAFRLHEYNQSLETVSRLY